MITKEEWVDWRSNHVTQAFLNAMYDTREGKKEIVAEGRVWDNELYLEIGRIQGIKDCLDYALTDFEIVQLEETDA